MPRNQPDLFSASLAERRQHQIPAPIRVDDSQRPRLTPCRLPMVAVSHAVSPLSPLFQEAHGGSEGRQVSPCYPSGHPDRPPSECFISPVLDQNAKGTIIDMHRALAPAELYTDPPEPLFRAQSRTRRPRRSKSTLDGLKGGAEPGSPLTPLPVSSHVSDNKPVAQASDSLLFSPLAIYFRGHSFPSTKKGRKTLIGQNGWLERPALAPEKAKRASQKKAGILDAIKKIAKDMTSEFHGGTSRSKPLVMEKSTSHVPISLDAREQSLLYCELEFHLTTALNEYITAELDKGHLVPGNLKKVSDGWKSQGRPKVVGFRYDLETQLHLVSLHIQEFNFYGRRQSNPVEIAGLLEKMKTNARQIRVRTFCQPDSVVAKQLVDAQSLFNLVNVSNVQQAALAEVVQFFEVIVEREQDQRERRIREVRETRVPQPGQRAVDMEWRRDEFSLRERFESKTGEHVEQDPHTYFRQLP